MKIINSNSGFILIIGKPNVGKSTLFNSLIGNKISITANKPQTTRHKIIGIKTIGNKQAIYIDTPGIHTYQKKSINIAMNRTAISDLNKVDLILFVVEALSWNDEDKFVLNKISHINCPMYFILNKIDIIQDKTKLIPILKRFDNFKYDKIIPCTAIIKKHVSLIEKEVFKLLPKRSFFYPKQQITDKNSDFRIAEIIREKLTRELHAELPYALSVEIENNKQNRKDFINAIIWVERNSQKAIIIGKQGSMLKKIGQQSRLDINYLLKTTVHLELWVKVRNDWTNNKNALRNLGYLV